MMDLIQGFNFFALPYPDQQLIYTWGALPLETFCACSFQDKSHRRWGQVTEQQCTQLKVFVWDIPVLKYVYATKAWDSALLSYEPCTAQIVGHSDKSMKIIVHMNGSHTTMMNLLLVLMQCVS